MDILEKNYRSAVMHYICDQIATVMSGVMKSEATTLISNSIMEMSDYRNLYMGKNNLIPEKRLANHREALAESPLYVALWELYKDQRDNAKFTLTHGGYDFGIKILEFTISGQIDFELVCRPVGKTGQFGDWRGPFIELLKADDNPFVIPRDYRYYDSEGGWNEIYHVILAKACSMMTKEENQE